MRAHNRIAHLHMYIQLEKRLWFIPGYPDGLLAVRLTNQTGNRLAAETASYLSVVLLGMLTYTTLGKGLAHGHGDSSVQLYS